MKLMTSVLVTVVLTLLVAGTSTAGPGGFPLEACFSGAKRRDFKNRLCSDLDQTEEFCRTYKPLLNNCKDQIMNGTHAQSILQAAADCLHTVADITVPAANTVNVDVFTEYLQSVVTNVADLCFKVEDLVTCFKQNTGMAQLMKDCIAQAGQ
ncbi:uncharacterized protein [Procambarus clarkii]|uniref:uncharacterized protein n=1 Tax=Procambarus clarkii TaxID=6728 RepID=UPI001E671789|nr:uncharacterized protein LOC123747417 [Procambarus clarkii]